MRRGDWVKAGGPHGALGECTRCGKTLHVELPQAVTVVVAAMTAFVKAHSHCKEKVADAS